MRACRPRSVVIAIAAALTLAAASPAGPSPVARTAYLMGTRATLVTYDRSRPRALARLDGMLRVLEATEAELSTWRDDTELGRLNASPPGEPFRLSERTCRTLGEVGRWVAETGGVFDPAVKPLIDAWGIRSGGVIPSAADLDSARRASGFARLHIDPRSCVAVPEGAVALDAGGFGKGVALDRASAAAGQNLAWLIDLGGQVMVSGAPPGADGWTIDLADPRDRFAAAVTLVLDRGSIATSGGSERDWSANGVRVGHILDPRTGRPAGFAGSVTVWHPRALVADLLSTALFVMGPDEGIAWADARGLAALFLDAPAADGPLEVRVSRAWRAAGLAYDTGVSGIGRR